MTHPRFVLAVAALLAADLVSAGEPFRYPEASQGKGRLKYVNHLPVLTVAGTPEEIGAAVGTLALVPAQPMVSYPDDLLKHYSCSFLRATFLRQGNRMFEHFPAEYQRELEAMARAAPVDHDRLVLGNTLFDLKKMLACSALLLEPWRSATGAPLLARNLDYPSLGYAHEYSLVTVYRPQGKHAFTSVGFPGLVGCLSGMNDAGLAVAVLEVFQVQAGWKKLDRGGLPYALCYRRILEECTTIAKARALLESMHRATITNLVLADRQGVAVFEVCPERVVQRGPSGGECICTNHYCSAQLRPLLPLNICRSFERYDILQHARPAVDQFDVADLHRALHAACDPKETLQTMIFEPATLRLHLAVGTCPASAGEMRTLELAPLLQGQ
jgi:hypothetical protein